MATLATFSTQGAEFNMLSCCPGEDTANEARFVWHSDSSACLLYCAKASDPASAYRVLPYAKTKKPVAFRKEDVTYYKYEAEISRLEPGTEYVYWVEAGDEASARQTFRTAGTSGSYNFLWMSDVHAHPDDADKMKTVELLRQDAEARTAASGGIDFVLFSGDAVKYGSRYDNWQQWNGAPSVTNYTFALIPGNKEYYYTGSNTFYDYNWYLATRNNPPNGPDATNEEGCYWFMRDGVMFVGIDSLVHKGSRMDMYGKKDEVLTAQTNWFDKVVTSQRGRFRWLVVFQHDPWFVCSSDGFDKSRGNYDVWRRVFDKHKVDLALSGDEHNYIRSKPLKGDAAAADGTIYMVAGQIEAENYSATVTTDIAGSGNASATKYFDCMGATDGLCGAAWIEVRPDSLKVTEFWDKWQSPGYKVYDTVTIAPKERGWAFEEIGERAHTRYRFAVDAPKSDNGSMQLSEIELLDESGAVIAPGAFTLAYDSTTPGTDGMTYPANESPENAADGNLATKWLDWRAGITNAVEVRSAVWLDFCFAEPVKLSGYRWYTANDASSFSSRNPAAWTFSAYDDGDETMYVLDRVTGFNATTANKALAYPAQEEGSDHDWTAEPDSAATAACGMYYALSVGVGNYNNNRQNALKGCVPDAKNVLSACTNEVKGLWMPKNCHCLCDDEATRTAVREQFQSLAATAKSGDMVLYYHSSHGGEDCICLYDKEYYADQFAEDLLRFASGVRVVVILDTCYSASMFKGAEEESAESGPWAFAAAVEARMANMRPQTKGAGDSGAAGPSVGWITACDDDQTSLDIGSGGWFTTPFVKAWKADATDANGDGFNDFKEVFNVAAPKAIDGARAPQTLNEDLLRSIAAWSFSGRPYTWDRPEWILESAATHEYTGEWASGIEYGADDRAQVYDNVFTPYIASTASVVAVEATARFFADDRSYTPAATDQAAIRLTSTGFQVWTGGAWLPVSAPGVTSENGAEYTLRVTFDYAAGKYSVEAGSSRFRATNGTQNFPLAASTTAVSSIAFMGDTDFTSLVGEYVTATGFAENEEIALAGATNVLTAARALWLSGLGATKAEVAAAAASLSADDFDAAYLLNIDFTEGEFSYSFEITDIAVHSDRVAVEVTLHRTGTTKGAINGTLNFYGAATLAGFQDPSLAPLKTATFTTADSNGDEKAPVEISLDGETPPAFFKAKIEE